MKITLIAPGLLACSALLWGCTNAELYRTTQSWAKQECRKLPDPAERSRCEKSNAASYEQYRAEADAARTAGARSP
jgi:hypothetical protein